MTPKVSVLMPVRNAGATVWRALASISSQTFGDFEFIVVDNGSTDETRDTLETAGRYDRRIRILTERRRGIVRALNLGIAHAAAPLIARMDADDEALPDRLWRQEAAMRRRPELGALGTAIVLVGPDGTEQTVRLPTDPLEIRTRLRSLDRFFVLAHPTAMMRASIVRKVGGYRPAFVHAEDYDLWLRISERASISNLTAPLFRYDTTAMKKRSYRYRLDQLTAVVTANWSARLRRSRFPDALDGAQHVLDDDEIDRALGPRRKFYWLDYLFLLSTQPFAENERGRRIAEVLPRLPHRESKQLSRHFASIPWTATARRSALSASRGSPLPAWMRRCLEG